MGLLNNRYLIISELSKGGFGRTYVAEDTYLPSRRRCVIKQLAPSTSDPELLPIIQERFQREAATLERIGELHNQVPDLYAYFVEDGQFYLVQEKIDGPTLGEKVRAEGPLSSAAVREILVSLLPVLECLHSNDIIHRDIKPDNIILRERDNKPILIDFGAVKETFSTVLDRAGGAASVIVGSPGYMPLEQAAGRPVCSSDIFSLGWTAIYLLTRKTPLELLDRRTEKNLWRQHALNVDPGLAAIIDKAIEPVSYERYKSASEMLRALEQSGENLAPTRLQVPKETLIEKPVASERSAQAAPTVPLVPTVLSQPIPTMQMSRAESETMVRPVARNEASWLSVHSPKLAIGCAALLLFGTLTMAGTLLVIKRWRDHTRATTSASPQPSPGPSASPVTSAALAAQHNSAGDALYKSENYAGAETEFREAVRLDPSNALYHDNLGLALNGQGRYADAEPELRAAIRLAPSNADYHDDLGLALDNQRKYTEAESEQRTAIRLEPNSARHHNNLGVVLEAEQRYADAESEFRTANRLVPNQARYIDNLGDALRYQKKYAEAEMQYREAVRLNPNSAGYHNDLGLALFGQQKYSGAETEFKAAVRLDTTIAVFHDNLGDALSSQKRYTEAESEYREAVRLAPSNATYHDDLGLALKNQGRYPEAEAEERTAVRLEPNSARHHYNLGAVLEAEMKFSEAEAEKNRAKQLAG